ncbi:hypothetical protein D920_00765 [Enterococcus faecalis 13-SD-W-01]|nr:hypothetical protein D920_00765 [Enterococcus faecalis 13-SD-W-01]
MHFFVKFFHVFLLKREKNKKRSKDSYFLKRTILVVSSVLIAQKKDG